MRPDSAAVVHLSPQVQVSIVIPVYNEEANIVDLVERVGVALQKSGKSFELICVDDGSRDGSAAALERLTADRPWLKPLYLIRWSIQEIRRIAHRLARKRIDPAYVIAWSLWRRAHQAAAQKSHIKRRSQL